MKIAYYYQGNKEYINKLLDYDMTLLIDNDRDIKTLLEYNCNIKNIKYDNDFYDILISETDDIEKISAIKKVVIGNFMNKKNKIYYIEKFDLKKILEKPEKDNIKFSVVIPNYNNAEWISKTIESVLNQTYNNWEMYIIDDLSTDNSIKIIEKYDDERIELIQNKIKLYNGGSRNIGILKAKEKNPDGYLLFIDSDDWFANDRVFEILNNFIDSEDLITLDYQYYMGKKTNSNGKHFYRNKDELFMTIGSMCAVWCKCFKVSVAPLFEFNTLMEDRNYHYRLVNRCQNISNLGQVTHIWNKMNTKSITTDKKQKYNGDLQTKLEWDHCAYRHIAGMLDLLNELDNPKYINFIKRKIIECKDKCNNGIYEQW